MQANNERLDNPFVTSLPLKIVMVGEANIGKTALLKKFSDSDFELTNKYSPTFGADFKTKTIVDNNKPITLTIWDLAGDEKFQIICKNYYPGAKGVIVAFDLTNANSLKKAKEHLETFKEYNIPMVLVGMKADLADLIVVNDQIEELLKQYANLSYFVTSAKTGQNVNEVFQDLSERALVKDQESQSQESTENLTQNIFANVSPSTFRLFITHPATIVLLVLLIAALAVLTYGLVGIGLAVVAGAVIGSAAIASTAVGGAVAVASGIGLASSGLFAHKQANTTDKTINNNPLSFDFYYNY